ncbi:microtubule-associated proteins 1A/1B light chain 3A-like [Eleutherodactylus coqui]|uniref:Uncharacterized protein n=1 Tax=Eleutherodactylus coqui TaxID=57060 RepID=A0A8J6K4Y7_ELECQ|nr:hypothetical protein GDO78_003741 [Eleutherodactylus coqui]
MPQTVTMPPLMSSLELNTTSFKQRKRLDSRIHEVNRVKSRYPCKIPVIVERSHREKRLPPLQKIKFLVPPEITMGQFVSMIRCRLTLPPSHSLCILVNEFQMPSLSMTMLEVYAEHQDQDGFLYVTYKSHEVFG